MTLELQSIIILSVFAGHPGDRRQRDRHGGSCHAGVSALIIFGYTPSRHSEFRQRRPAPACRYSSEGWWSRARWSRPAFSSRSASVLLATKGSGKRFCWGGRSGVRAVRVSSECHHVILLAPIIIRIAKELDVDFVADGGDRHH